MTYDQILKESLKSLRDVKGNLSSVRIKGKILDDIINATNFLDGYNPSHSERIYCIENDIYDIVKCPMTGEKLKYHPNKKSYSQSRKYAHTHKKRPPNSIFTVSFNKAKNKVFDTYNSNDFQILSKDVCIKIFEKLTPNKKSRINSRIAKNNIDFSCSMIYHTQFLGTDELKFSERYYCIKNNLFEIPSDEKNRQLSYINRFEGYSVYPDKIVIYEDYKENANKEIEQKFKILDTIKTEGKGQIKRIELECKECGYQFSRLFKTGLWRKLFCPDCLGFNQRSKAEDEIITFLKENGINNIIANDREFLNGLEIDVMVPDCKLAIEYCGIIWHSFGTKFPSNDDLEKDGKNKHLNKFEKCKEKGVTLLTIFENEWILKKDIVKSMILNKIGKSGNKIFARNCEFRIVDSKTARQFLDDNHIQGKCNSSESYGLYHNDVLVSLMCFGKRKITRGEVKYELLRFCNKIGYSVVGGASKLLKNSKVEKCISYCDLRYSNGNLYDKLGMKLLNQSKPNYYYTKNNIDLFHRANFQKHKIIDSPTKLTETEIMYDRGYRKIYDCGNLVFEYRREY
jgi:hypothetical protein